MQKYKNVKRMADEVFADHRMKKGPGLSWRLAKPGTGMYSFRVTWTPGAAVISGDIGDATYNVWPAFADLWDAVQLINGADFSYLAGKSTIPTEFDQEATVRNVLRCADDEMRFSDIGEECPIWKALFDWCDDPLLDNHRNGSQQMQVAKWFRESSDIGPETAYCHFALDRIDDWHCMLEYSYPARAMWCFEALKLWARTMEDKKPFWVELHRWWKYQKEVFKDYRLNPVVYRPQFFWHDPNGCNRHFSMNDRPHVYALIKRKRKDGSFYTFYSSIKPWKLFGRDMSDFGFYKTGFGGSGGGSDMIPCPPGVKPSPSY